MFKRLFNGNRMIQGYPVWFYEGFLEQFQWSTYQKNVFLWFFCSAVVQTTVFAMDLHEAARIGDVKQVRALLPTSAGANLNWQDKYGSTPLHWAARNGHQVIVQILLAAGAKVDMQTKYGYTSLHCASLNGHQAVVQVLLSAHANPNQQANSGWTPLHCAASSGCQAVAQVLLRNGANPNLQDNFGCTPLRYVVSNGYTAQVIKDYIARQEIGVFVQALHQRLGTNSEARVLRCNEYKEIFEYLRYIDR
jgi:hypothetical protein